RKLKRLTGIRAGVKRDFKTWFGTGKTGVYPASVRGACRFLYFMGKTEHGVLQMKLLIMFPSCSPNTVPMFGLKEKRKISCRKDLLRRIVQTANSRKKRILWTFGLIPVLPIKLYC